MDAVDQVRWRSRPSLDRPVLVAAFEGWNDAAEAASGLMPRHQSHWKPSVPDHLVQAETVVAFLHAVRDAVDEIDDRDHPAEPATEQS